MACELCNKWRSVSKTQGDAFARLEMEQEIDISCSLMGADCEDPEDPRCDLTPDSMIVDGRGLVCSMGVDCEDREDPRCWDRDELSSDKETEEDALVSHATQKSLEDIKIFNRCHLRI